MQELPDVQNQNDTRGVDIQRVGIVGLHYPLMVERKGTGAREKVSATVKLFVGLPKEYKGINMSRLTQSVIEASDSVLSPETLPTLLKLLQTKLNSTDAYARFDFDYFIPKETPATKLIAPQRYRCSFTGILKGDEYTFVLGVEVIGASVCPCSREMSLLENQPDLLPEKYKDTILESGVANKVGMGAHNQRSKVCLQIVSTEKIWIEDLVAAVEERFSAPVYPLLKRPDERAVTEMGYNNAKFVEDIARDLTLYLNGEPKITAWAVSVENYESIHPFNVKAYQKSDNWKYSYSV